MSPTIASATRPLQYSPMHGHLTAAGFYYLSFIQSSIPKFYGSEIFSNKIAWEWDWRNKANDDDILYKMPCSLI